jgi:hypothetical protein
MPANHANKRESKKRILLKFSKENYGLPTWLRRNPTKHTKDMNKEHVLIRKLRVNSRDSRAEFLPCQAGEIFSNWRRQTDLNQAKDIFPAVFFAPVRPQMRN